jgi:hypothetical protein
MRYLFLIFMIFGAINSFGQQIEQKDTVVNLFDYWNKINEFIKPDSMNKHDRWERNRLLQERYVSRDNSLFAIYNYSNFTEDKRRYYNIHIFNLGNQLLCEIYYDDKFALSFYTYKYDVKGRLVAKSGYGSGESGKTIYYHY